MVGLFPLTKKFGNSCSREKQKFICQVFCDLAEGVNTVNLSSRENQNVNRKGNALSERWKIYAGLQIATKCNLCFPAGATKFC